MLDEKQIERYRKMTLEERRREAEAVMEAAWRMLQALPYEERERRLAEERAEKEEADQRIIEFLRRFP